MIKIHIDGKTVSATPGKTLLETCLDNEIYVPNLCYVKGMGSPPASCRLCFVEIDGASSPVPACSIFVESEMRVRTDTPEVRRLQRSALRLILSAHRIECRKCPANLHCPLQKIARFLEIGLKSGPFKQHLKASDIDHSHPVIKYHPNRCTLCGRCIHVCRNRNGDSLITFAGRGFDTYLHIGHDSSGKAFSCLECLECSRICPVSALLVEEGSAVNKA